MVIEMTTMRTDVERPLGFTETEYVVGLLLDPAKQRVVLLRKQHPEWQRGLWNGPGGHVEDDEPPVEAMRREFEEETGVALVNWRRMATLTIVHVAMNQASIVHFFTAADEQFSKVESQTQEVVGVFRVDRLPRAVMPNLNWLIAMAALDNELCWPYDITCEDDR